MVYQDTNLKICLGLFSWKENILYKVHIWQWSDKQYSVHRNISKAIEKNTSCTFFSAMFHRNVFIAVYSNLVIAKNVRT